MPRIADLQRLLESSPDDPFLLYALAQAHAAAGEHEAALSWYDRCLRVAPDDPYAHYHKARSLLALGREAQATEALHAGIRAAERSDDEHARAEIAFLLATLSP